MTTKADEAVGDANQFAGWDTDRLVDFLREHADAIPQDGEYGKQDAQKIKAAANRLSVFYWGTKRAQPAEQLAKAHAKNVIYKRQLRELQRILERHNEEAHARYLTRIAFTRPPVVADSFNPKMAFILGALGGVAAALVVLS